MICPKENAPIDATHFLYGFGEEVAYYRECEYPYLNQETEEWETRVKWRYWNAKTKMWTWVGVGFCSRRLMPIGVD